MDVPCATSVSDAVAAATVGVTRAGQARRAPPDCRATPPTRAPHWRSRNRRSPFLGHFARSNRPNRQAEWNPALRVIERDGPGSVGPTSRWPGRAVAVASAAPSAIGVSAAGGVSECHTHCPQEPDAPGLSTQASFGGDSDPPTRAPGMRLPDLTAADLTIVPANQASWEDLQGRLRGARVHGDLPMPAVQGRTVPWREPSVAVRQDHLRRETHCDFRVHRNERPRRLPGWRAGGVVRSRARSAYDDAWQRTKLTVRGEDRPTGRLAVTCFATAPAIGDVASAGPRGRRGRLRAPARARAVEAYPMITEPAWRSPGAKTTWAPAASSWGRDDRSAPRLVGRV